MVSTLCQVTVTEHPDHVCGSQRGREMTDVEMFVGEIRGVKDWLNCVLGGGGVREVRRRGKIQAKFKFNST